ncbi:hypothetical protein ACIQXA_28870 [Streptomyces massasporeus]|uniref:hypothetical protein n=1 Tax=Streptomyces massasporeus TaxID=67324 RepID=UPI003828DFD7
MPRSDRIEYDEQTRAAYWVVPMFRPGRLCTPADVPALVMAGRCVDSEHEV